MSIRIDGTNTTANPGITGGDADTGLHLATDEIQLVTGGTARVTVGSTGNFTIENGNLVLASGSGIDFSATANSSGTMTSELLDDYEEGTWNVRISGRTTNGTAVDNRTANASYVKVGNQVTVHFDFDQTLSSASGDWQILGLPFVVHSGPFQRFTGSIAIGTNSSTWASAPLLYANDGGTSIWLIQNNSGTNWSFVTVQNARTECWGVLTYFVD